jgi:hypothetical protein
MFNPMLLWWATKHEIDCSKFIDPSPHPSPTEGRGGSLILSFYEGMEKNKLFPRPTGGEG